MRSWSWAKKSAEALRLQRWLVDREELLDVAVESCGEEDSLGRADGCGAGDGSASGDDVEHLGGVAGEGDDVGGIGIDDGGSGDSRATGEGDGL